MLCPRLEVKGKDNCDQESGRGPWADLPQQQSSADMGRGSEKDRWGSHQEPQGLRKNFIFPLCVVQAVPQLQA